MKQKLIVFLQLLPIVLSMLILSAHYLRYANMVEVAICLMLPFLLFIKSKIVVRILQLALVVAAFVWVDTVLNLINIREHIGHAWTRMAIILGGVILFTLSSGFVFYTKTLRERYGLVKGF
ncbi:MAG: hypothetical protein OQK48_06670 [Sulfurimonas sp.]|uniref:hypothetical protein n=1 Tax=Sulfurimonas sp. TaxID=2022749 RepID=UPI00262A50D5|nr:hypothetical protein [Sulfurimonas sp.]MCW8894739.1 hypothetical protein [Sulfurimonas sp.]MCW8954616.1 hypothetical protein [Sulfurimonas sp.]MCW9067548.1 hypothetical protein [Sulfurimonas sp.]